MGFYGPLYFRKHCKAWTNLLALLESVVGLWLCFGDFNLIIDAKEKSVVELVLVQLKLFEEFDV